MTIQDLIKAIDALSAEDLEKLQRRIDTRRQRVGEPDEQRLMEEITAILQNAERPELVAGTMDTDRLTAAFAAIREGLSQQELDEIADAMNAE